MHAIGNWLLQHQWVGLALGGAVGAAVGALLIYLGNRVRELKQNDGDELRAASQQRQQLLLYCEDAKVVADLAIQRHMSDAMFLRNLRAQPCFDALSPYFGGKFQELIAREPRDQETKTYLAVACQEEIARLEATVGPVDRHANQAGRERR